MDVVLVVGGRWEEASLLYGLPSSTAYGVVQRAKRPSGAAGILLAGSNGDPRHVKPLFELLCTSQADHISALP